MAQRSRAAIRFGSGRTAATGAFELAGHARHGDEPVEAQAFIAAGRGVTVAHRLNVILDPTQIAAVALQDGPVRHIQAAIMREQRAPAALAVIDALHDVARRHTP